MKLKIIGGKVRDYKSTPTAQTLLITETMNEKRRVIWKI